MTLRYDPTGEMGKTLQTRRSRGGEGQEGVVNQYGGTHRLGKTLEDRPTA
jgi:hypothetical protein